MLNEKEYKIERKAKCCSYCINWDSRRQRQCQGEQPSFLPPIHRVG